MNCVDNFSHFIFICYWNSLCVQDLRSFSVILLRSFRSLNRSKSHLLILPLFVVNFSYFGISTFNPYLKHIQPHTHTQIHKRMYSFVNWMIRLSLLYDAGSLHLVNTGLNSIEEKCFSWFICIQTNEPKSHSFRIQKVIHSNVHTRNTSQFVTSFLII